MDLIRSVDFRSVLTSFKEENPGAAAFQWTVNRLHDVERESSNWELVDLSSSDIRNIMIRGGHCHSIPEAPCLIGVHEIVSIAKASERVRGFDRDKMPDCWKNIEYQKHRDISQTHLFLSHFKDQFWHIDGFHRMLAWVLFEKQGSVPAFVAGL